jgi:hypothetical protein
MTGLLLIAGAFWFGQAAPAVPVCEPYQLSPRYGIDGAAGANYAKITVENVSDTPCVLAGVPEVRRYDEQSNRIETSVTGGVALTTAGAGKEKLLLRPKASATFVMASEGRTGRTASRRCASYLLVSLRYSGHKFRPFAVIDMESCRPSVMLSGFVEGAPSRQ